MKKLFVSYLFIAFFLTVNSLTADCQITKGNWIVGGTGNFFSRNGTYTAQAISYDSKYIDLTVSPNVGYFIIDKLAVGLKPSYSWSKSKTFPPGGGSTNIKRVLIGPFARYYLLNTEKEFNIITEGTFGSDSF